MKTSTNPNHLKPFALVTALVLLSSLHILRAQCTANFTYTVGTGSVSFTDASVGTTTNTTYNWNWSGPGGWGTSSQPNPTFNFTYNGTYYVYLQIYDSLANCQSYAFDSVLITNGQPCQVSFTYTVGGNGQVNFTNTSVGNASYYWDFGDGNTSTLVSPSNTYAFNGTYTVNLWADTTGGHCGGFSQAIILINNAQPCNVVASYTTSSSGNGVYIFWDTVTTNPPSFMYHSWYLNGTYIGSGNPFTIQFPANGIYNVCEVVNDSANFGGNGCSDTACTNITISGLTCNDSAYFFLVPDSSNFGGGSNGVWYAYVYSWNNNWPTNAVWSWGDGTTSSGLYPSHTYANPGWYNICVTAYFPCGDSSTYCEVDSLYRSSSQMVTVNVVSGANGIHNNKNNMTALNAYPNPFGEELSIDFTSYENKDVTCALFDMMGNLVMKQNVSANRSDNHVHMNTSELTRGVYFVQLNGPNGKATTMKVVK